MGTTILPVKESNFLPKSKGKQFPLVETTIYLHGKESNFLPTWRRSILLICTRPWGQNWSWPVCETSRSRASLRLVLLVVSTSNLQEYYASMAGKFTSCWPAFYDWEVGHGLNMELDLQNLFGAPCAQLYSLAGTPQLPPPPHLGSYTSALFVSQDRRHLFVTPWGRSMEERGERGEKGEAGCPCIVWSTDEWTINTPNPRCRLFFKICLLTDFAACVLQIF